MRKDFYIYYLIDYNTNLPFYVGKGTGNRIYDHEKCILNGKTTNKNPILSRKIKKIINSGHKIIYKKIIENITEQEAFLLEQSEIKKYGRLNNKSGILCNMTNGGEGGSGHIMNDNTKKRMSLLHSGINNPFYGKHHTEENLEKISQASMGNKYSVGLIHNSETLRNLSEINKGKIVSEQTRHKMSISRSGKSTKIPINQYDKNMIFIKRWKSASCAAKELNISKSCLSDCLRNRMKTYKGYIWKYD